MSNQDPGNRGQRPPMPTMVRVGPGHRGGTGGETSSSGEQLPPGAGLATMAPDLDLKAMSLVAYEPSLLAMDLRDRKNTPLRIRRAVREASPYMLVVGAKGREGRPMPINAAMGSELALAAHAAVLHAAKNAKPKTHDAALEFIGALAKAAGCTLPSAPQRSTTGTLPTADENSSFAQAQKNFAGNTTPLRAPPAIPPTANARPEHTTDALQAAMPGILFEELMLQDVQLKQGFLELEDPNGGRISLQQTKYTPPPQFTIEHALKGQAAARRAVTGPMARELAHILTVALLSSEHADDATMVRGMALYTQALLRVP